MIVAAAIKVGDLICSLPIPARHHHIIRALASAGAENFDERKEGFLSDQGLFLNRREAWDHAHTCGQGTPRRDAILKANPNTYDGFELFSEDLW